MKKQQKPQLTGPMADIEVKTQVFADARNGLITTVSCLNDELDSVKKKYRTRLIAEVGQVRMLRADLHAAVEANPALFEKPRSQIFHGVKVGYRKGAGKVTFVDADQVVKLIWLRLPEKAQTLIKTTEKPNKEAIAELEVAELKRIGCSIEATADVVEIKSVDSEVDKLVAALLKEETEEAGA